MKLTDCRHFSPIIEFDKLPIGAYYQDEDGDINIKTSNTDSIYYNDQNHEWYPSNTNPTGTEVILLDANVTVKYCNGINKE